MVKMMKFVADLSFEGTCHQAAQEIAPQEDIDQQGWERG